MTSSTHSASSPSPKNNNNNNIEYDPDGYGIACSSSETSTSDKYASAFGYGQLSTPSDDDKYASAFGYGQLSTPSDKTTSEWATTSSGSNSDKDNKPPSFSKRSVPTTKEQAKQGKLTSALSETISKTNFHAPRFRGVVRNILVDIAGVEPEKSPMIKKREMAWVCDNCGAQNLPFDFLCWSCKAHHRCKDCKAVVNDEVVVAVKE